MARHDRHLRPYRTFHDQHGRKWGAPVEHPSGHPCGPIDCLQRTPAGRRPPWVPSDQFLVFDPVDVGQVRVDYDRCLAEFDRGLADWQTLVRRQASAMYADGAGPIVEKILAGADPSPALRAVTGLRPVGRELIAAAKAGNKWVLGFSDAVPQWARPVLAQVEAAEAAAEQVVVAEQAYPDADEEDDALVEVTAPVAIVEEPAPKAAPKRSHHKQPARAGAAG
jgi:hypothetical protein